MNDSASLNEIDRNLAALGQTPSCSAFKISGDTRHQRKIQTMLLLVEFLDGVTSSIVVSELGLVRLLVKHGLVVPHSSFENVDW